MINYIAGLFGIIAWVILLFSYFKTGSNKLLYLQIISCIFFALNYIFLGALSGLLVVIFEIIRDYLYIKVKDDKKVFYISIFFYLIIALFSYNGILSLVCILASLCDSYALANNNSNKIILYSIFTYSLWIVYDLSCYSYGTVLFELFLVLSNILFLSNCYSVYLKSDKLMVVKGFSITNNMMKMFNKIDKSNYNEEYIWSLSKEKEVIMNNKTDYIFIYDEDNLVGYINFIRITKDKFDSIINSNKYIDIDIKDIKKFSKKNFNYVNVNSISIKSVYKNDKLIKLINSSIRKYLIKKESYGYKIKGLVCISASSFEEEILSKCGFMLIKNINTDNSIYVMDHDDLSIYLKEF